MIYAWIGRAVVKVLKAWVLLRYRTQLRVGVGLLAVLAAVAGYLLARDVPEG